MYLSAESIGHYDSRIVTLRPDTNSHETLEAVQGLLQMTILSKTVANAAKIGYPTRPRAMRNPQDPYKYSILSTSTLGLSLEPKLYGLFDLEGLELWEPLVQRTLGRNVHFTKCHSLTGPGNEGRDHTSIESRRERREQGRGKCAFTSFQHFHGVAVLFELDPLDILGDAQELVDGDAIPDQAESRFPLIKLQAAATNLPTSQECVRTRGWLPSPGIAAKLLAKSTQDGMLDEKADGMYGSNQ